MDKDGLWQAKSRGTKSELALVKEKSDNSQATKIGFESIDSQPPFVGLDYNSEDRQRDENEQKLAKKRKTKREWRRKNARSKNKVGQKNNAQHQRGMKPKGGGKRNRNRRGEKTKNTNLNRKNGNWRGEKKRKWKGRTKSNSKGNRNTRNGKGNKTPNWKSTSIKLIQNQNELIRCFEFKSSCFAL